MSDTKWRKLFKAVEAAHPELESMLVKFVDVDEPHLMQFPPSLRCPHAYMDNIEFGPTELRAIEWLEFRADISRAMIAIGRFPLAVSGGQTRVVAYGDPLPVNGS